MTLKEDIAAMQLRIARAESERDRWRVSGMQEKYLEAYSMDEARKHKQLEWEPVEVNWFDRQNLIEASGQKLGLEIFFPAAAAVFKSDATRRYFLGDKESAADFILISNTWFNAINPRFEEMVN